MSDLVVVVASGGLRGVHGVLRDWSAVGLVRPFVWSDGPRVEWIADGEARSTAVHEAVSAARAETVVLTVLGGTDPSATAPDGPVVRRIEGEISESVGHHQQIVRCRVTAARKGDSGTVSTVATAGWSNIVLSPEEGAGPWSGRKILDAATPADEMDVHLAAALAGSLGLWAEAGSSAPAPAASAAAVIERSFVRRLDSLRAEQALRAAVLSTRTGMPLPRVAGGAEYIEDVPLATATMADAFWKVNAGVLRGARERHVPVPATRVGPLEALRMFFGFLLAALRNAPRAWLIGTIHRARAAVAGSVQSFVFGGSNAAFDVVVGGVLPDGRPASWGDVGDALDAIAGTDRTGRHLPHEDLTSVWNSYAAAVLTLCDAGARMPTLPVVEIGTRKGVLRDSDDAVPSSDRVFSDMPPALLTHVSDPPAPYDTLAAAELEQQLAALASRPGAGVAASAALESLRRWRARFAPAFATRIASRLGEELVAVRSELDALVRKLRDAEGDDVDDRLVRAQRSLARTLRIMAIVAVVVLVAVGALAGVGVIALSLAAIVGGGVLAAWLVSSLVVFLRGQSALFRLLARRRELAGEREIDERNLRHVLRDARRLVDAYPQLQRWSEVLGSVLSEPFGRPTDAVSDPVTRLTGLPASVVIGEAVVDEPAVELVAAELRRLVFEPGWLDAPWTTVIQRAHSRLGGRGVEFRDAPDLLLRQLGEGEHTVLPAFARHVMTHGVDTVSGDELWTRAVATLEGNTELATRLVQRVSVSGGEISYAEFFASLADASTAHAGSIDDSVLRPEVALSAGATTVAEGEPVLVSRGLSRFVLLRQRTRGIPEYEYSFYGAGSGGGPLSIPAPGSDSVVL